MIVRVAAVVVTLALSACAGPEYHDLDGNALQLDQFRGRWVVINYWAIWCQPCREEIPELNQLAADAPERIALLGVSFDLPPLEEATEQARSLGIAFPVLLEDPAPELGYARPEVLPTTVLLDPDGAIASILEGPQSAASIVAAIEAP